MPSCEKCWRDACGDPEEYERLLDDRKERPCTPQEQAGPSATKCQKCKIASMHQYTRACVVCGYRAETAGKIGELKDGEE